MKSHKVKFKSKWKAGEGSQWQYDAGNTPRTIQILVLSRLIADLSHMKDELMIETNSHWKIENGE